MKTKIDTSALFEDADNRLATLGLALRGLGDLFSSGDGDLHLVNGEAVGCLVGVLAGAVEAARVQAYDELQAARARPAAAQPSGLRFSRPKPAHPAQN